MAASAVESAALMSARDCMAGDVHHTRLDLRSTFTTRAGGSSTACGSPMQQKLPRPVDLRQCSNSRNPRGNVVVEFICERRKIHGNVKRRAGSSR